MTSQTMEVCRILAVDDEPANLRLLERLLAVTGYANVRTTTDPREVLGIVEEYDPDLILLDLHMPNLDGFEVMRQLAEVVPADSYLPILVLTADITPEAQERALQLGAKDFVTKPFRRSEVLLRIQNLLDTRSLHLRLRRNNATLEQRVWERTLELEEAQGEVLDRLMKAAEYRDDDTGQHAHRVGELSARTAEALGVPSVEVEVIRRAAPLHDTGKIAIPDAILLKPGRLTPEEFEVMKTHAAIGAQMLSGGRSELMQLAEQIALGHHERWDGSGYPNGLAGEDIPLVARIVAIADFHDALSHDRTYRPAWPKEKVIQEIQLQSGRHFDPRVAETFLQLHV